MGPARRVLFFVVMILLPRLASGGEHEAADTRARLHEVTVHAHGDTIEVAIKAAGPPRYRAALLDAPSRLVLDFEGTACGCREMPLQILTEPLRQIRGSQYGTDVTRVVLEFTRRAEYTIHETPDGLVIVIPATTVRRARLANPAAGGGSPTITEAAPGEVDVQQPGAAGGSLGIKGTAIVKSFAYFSKTSNDDHRFYDEGILQIEWARRLAPWMDAKAVVEGRADDNDYADGLHVEVPDVNRHRSYLDLKEAVLGLQKDPLRLTIGKQFFTWGTADGYNPTDNLNPYDYMDPIDREKLAVYSVAAQVTAGRASLTLVVVPLFTPSRVPLATSRWVPPVPEDIAALTGPRELPPTTLENMQYAARLRGTVAGWDLSVSYFEGFEPTPVIKQTAVVTAPGVEVSQLVPVFTRMRVAGFDFSTTFGKLEVHGEAAAKFVVRNGRDDRFQGIAGFNYAWDELGLRWLERIHVIGEYAREEIITSDSRSDVLPQNELLALPNNGFQSAAIGRLLFYFNDATQFEVGGTANFVGSPSYYLRFGLTHKATDAFHVTAGLDLIDGPRDTFWGRWRDNDRVFVFLKYFF